MKKRLAEIQSTLPKDIIVEVNIDNGVFIAASLKNVVFALTETLILVLVVIFLFLGTLRATLIPAVTIPVSIVAAAIVMLALDYSINTLTLLGAVLAIGLVVDDAIVVLENIVRRIEGGEPPVLASINGSKEIGFAVIATTLVLMAVFVPVSFMTGDTGRLFGEFGVTVAAAVGFSAFVALTLTPMMASKLFANGMPKSRMAGGIDRVFHNLDERYAAGLRRALDRPAPAVDRGRRAGPVRRAGHAVRRWAFRSPGCDCRASSRRRKTAPSCASSSRRRKARASSTSTGSCARSRQSRMDEVERGNARRVIARTGGFGRSAEANTGCVMLPLNLWDEREESAGQIADRLRQRTQDISGARVNVNQAGSPLTRNSTRPLAIALGGGDYAEIVEVARQDHAARRGRKPAHPQPRVRLPRAPAARHRADRPQQGRGSRRLAADRRAHARDHARLAHRHHFRTRRRGIRRDPAGARRAARHRRRSRQSLRALRQERRPAAALGAGAHRRTRRAH